MLTQMLKFVILFMRKLRLMMMLLFVKLLFVVNMLMWENGDDAHAS